MVEADTFSTFAAQHHIEKNLRVKHHPVAIAFAITDYKLQGRTLSELIVLVCRPAVLPKRAQHVGSQATLEQAKGAHAIPYT